MIKWLNCTKRSTFLKGSLGRLATRFKDYVVLSRIAPRWCGGGGRTFPHRIIALLRNLHGRTRIRLSACFKADLAWWRSLSHVFNGVATMIHYNYGDGPVLFTDASNHGYGLVLGSDWQAGRLVDVGSEASYRALGHGHWRDVVKPLVSCVDDNINFRVIIPVWQALLRFTPRYRNQHLVLYSDNTQVIAMVNSGKSVNVSCVCLLREMFWICGFFLMFILLQGIYRGLIIRLLTPCLEPRKGMHCLWPIATHCVVHNYYYD